VAYPHGLPPADEGPSVRELVAALGESAASLVRDEAALAKRELLDALRGMRRGIVLVLGSAVLGLVGLVVLLAALIVALAPRIGSGQASLLVGVALGIAAFVAARSGLRRLGLDRLRPRETLETLHETRQWLKQLK
jgi:hypothetical protein